MKEKAGFIAKLDDASKPLVAQLKDDPEFDAPLQDAMRQRVLNFTEIALGKFKQHDPAVACQTILANIQGDTIDDLSQVVQDTYRTYLQVVRDAP